MTRDEFETAERCSACGELGCSGTCEQGRGGPADDGCCDVCGLEIGFTESALCDECLAELNMRDEPTTSPEDAAREDAGRGLKLGARVEVFIGRAWRVCVVVGEYLQVDGKGTLFESSPRRVVTLAQFDEYGRPFGSFTLGNGHGVRLVEPGLFGE